MPKHSAGSIPNVPNSEMAVDLAKVAADAEKSRNEREQAALSAAQRKADLWWKAMHRTFKGTIGGSRAQRRRALMAAAARQEREKHA
jgi:hypothetical protein